MTSNLWTCAKCKRTFARKNQSHTCKSIKLSYLFKKSPESIKNLFIEFQTLVGEVIPVKYDAISFAINMKSRRHMGMLFIKNDRIKVEFFLPELIKHPRIIKSASLNNSHTHIVEIFSKEDIDRQLLSWLKQAYEFNA